MNPGDRLELTQQLDPHSPLGRGLRGTITNIREHPALGFTQVDIDWDNEASRLTLVLPDDIGKFRMIMTRHDDI